MATTVTVPSILDSSPEKINGFKLRRLIVDGGTQALRKVFQKEHAGISVHTVLSANQHILRPLKGRVINQTQWDKLYPASPNTPDINTFDVTLLSILLRNICSLTTPATGWSTMPSASDKSDEANIVRIKFFRNELHAHISETGISIKDFESNWSDISPVLVSLGIDRKEIDRLKTEECEKDVVERVMNEWNAMEDEIRSDLKRIEETQEKTLRISSQTQEIVIENQGTIKEELARLQKELSDAKSSRSDEVLQKLARCDFTSEREVLCNKFVEGTRWWVFEQVDAWFKDNLSENRVFIISGNAGMGKSVIAAVVCERMNEHLAGCHFCRHNDIRYRDPKILLQSIALQICKVLPEFRQALINQLTRNFGDHNLNEMNIESLFTTLLKEPFVHIGYPGKKFLIVIDGVDESDDSKARHEFVDLIASHLHKLPNFIRFLITTRPTKNIIDKFRHLNSLYLPKHGVQNQRDLMMFFENKLSSNGDNILIQKLVAKFMSMSDGQMLFAYFIFEIFKEKQVIESFPTGLNRVYEMYFERLEGECKKVLKIDEYTFLSLLSAMTISREQLPLDFVVSILGVKTGTPSEKRNVVKAMNCISSLFVINGDHVSFFHKSVQDWLVSESDHLYKIDKKFGHKVLAKLCAECFDKIKATGLESSEVTTAVKSYALAHGFYHMIEDDDKFVSYANSYLVDVEIVYGHYIFLNRNMFYKSMLTKKIKGNVRYSQVRDKTRVRVEQFEKILMNFRPLLNRSSFSFLQHVINEATAMSSEALSLFMRMHPELPYFIKVNKYDAPANTEIIECSERQFACVDVCILKDCIVLCFESGAVKLISIKPFKEIWTKTFGKHQISCSCFAFHPHKDVILPGRLDQVLSLTDGTWQPGPFSCEEKYFFSNCCFSSENTIMITSNICDIYLVLWNLVNGENVRRIQCFGVPTSFCFSRSGNYLAVVENNSKCSLFEVGNNYKFLQTSTIGYGDFFSITYKSDSFIFVDKMFVIVAVLNAGDVYSHFINLGLGSYNGIFFPPSAKTLAIADCSNISQIVSKIKFLYWQKSNFRATRHDSFTLLDDEKLLAFVKSRFSWGSRRSLSFLFLPDAETAYGNISFDGQFYYQHCKSSRQLSIFSRYSSGWLLMGRIVQDVIAFDIVENGVFLATVESKIEIWNVELLECLERCQHSGETQRCESVSDYLVACVTKTEVNFVDSRTLQIVSTTSLSENQEVMACSSKYDVVVKDISFRNKECFIMRDNSKMHSLNDMIDVDIARFSPNANRLVFSSCIENSTECLEISKNSLSVNCYVKTENFNFSPMWKFCEKICFLDNDCFVVYTRELNEHVLSLLCASSGKTITFFPLCDQPTSFFYSRETRTLIVNYRSYNFEEFQLHWP